MIYFEYVDAHGRILSAGRVLSEADMPEIPEGAAVKVIDLSAIVCYEVVDADGKVVASGSCPRELVPEQALIEGCTAREVDFLADFSPISSQGISVSYAVKRADAYPSVQDQLDMIYHEGLDAWREKIKAIKDEFPKGTSY